MEKEKLIELINKGLTFPQIGKELGKSEWAVRRLFKQYGLKTLRSVGSPLDTERKCKSCGVLKPIEKFALAGVIGETKYYRWKCSSCYCDQKTAKRTEVTEWVQGYKKEQKCSKCEIADFRVLDFHHTHNNKSFNISEAKSQGYSKESIWNEIKKCVVLCSNCHRIETYENRKNKNDS